MGGQSGESAKTGGDAGGVARVMGLESEYGISVPGDPGANPMILSGLVVRAYAEVVAPRHGGRVARWDYAGESPLHDARGWTLQRDLADASMLTDEWQNDVRVANCVTPNGARLYVDHAHPEYSSAECLTPREVVTWDRAGEQLVAEAAAAIDPASLAAADSTGAEVVLYKNNTDGKGNSYGTHENYLVQRAVPFDRIATGLIPYYIVRQIITGSGRVGLGQKSEAAGYQIGSRSDFMEALVGLETTFIRPMVNTRDEPHSSPEKYRRLHVINGDANMCDVPGLLKVGMTSLILGAIESGDVPERLRLHDPLADLRAVSRDLTLTHRLTLLDGSTLTAVELLREYLEICVACLDREAGHIDADTDEILRLWDETLTLLADDPRAAATRLDWAAKLELLERYRSRDGLDWGDPKLAAIDIQWSDLRPGKGLARALERAGRIERLIPQQQVDAAVLSPPPSTRAWLRGMCVSRFAEVGVASWQSVAFDLPDSPRLTCAEPLTGSRAAVGDLFDAAPDAATLVGSITARWGGTA